MFVDLEIISIKLNIKNFFVYNVFVVVMVFFFFMYNSFYSGELWSKVVIKLKRCHCLLNRIFHFALNSITLLPVVYNMNTYY